MNVAARPQVTRAHSGKRPGIMGWLLLLPMLLWLLAFVVAPTLILLVASFTQPDDNGFPLYNAPPPAEGEAQAKAFTTEHYKRIVVDDEGKFIVTEDEDILGPGEDGPETVLGTQKVTKLAAPYLRMLGMSVLYAGVCTLACIIIGYPVAWYIGRAEPGKRNLLLMAVMIPFWTSFLIRIYAWINILAQEGLLNGLLQYTRMISEPFEMLYSPGAVLLGLITNYLPFMILPIYGSVEKLDNSLVEAAFDLGAGPVRAFQRVILPLTRPGIVAGVLLVFVPAVGMFAITRMLGGTQKLFADTMEDQFVGQARNHPFGAALGMTLVALFLIAFVLSARLRRPAGE